MWPDKRVQNYIGIKVITGKYISDESLIEKLREVLFLDLHKNQIDLSLWFIRHLLIEKLNGG